MTKNTEVDGVDIKIAIIILLIIIAFVVMTLRINTLEKQIADLPKRVCHNETELVDVFSDTTAEIDNVWHFVPPRCDFEYDSKCLLKVTKEVCEIK